MTKVQKCNRNIKTKSFIIPLFTPWLFFSNIVYTLVNLTRQGGREWDMGSSLNDVTVWGGECQRFCDNSTKIMGEAWGGVKRNPNLRDVIYGRPLKALKQVLKKCFIIKRWKTENFYKTELNDKWSILKPNRANEAILSPYSTVKAAYVFIRLL